MASAAAYKDMAKSFLGGAGAVRTSNKWLSQINMLTIVLALVLSIMVINTHNKCPDKKFKQDSSIYFQYVVAILVLVFFLLLFIFDFGVMMKLF
jgi:hypothetical protein